jgi:undecaprenyl-diphosphatase
VREARLFLVRELATVFCALLLFVWLAVEARGPEPPAFDLGIRNAVHARASVDLTVVMRTVTNLGSGWFLWTLGLGVSLWLASAGRRRDAAWFAVAVLGANLLNETMKLGFHRRRPEAYFGYPLPVTYSFPSGHSFVSFCFYMTLAEILIRSHWPRWYKAAIIVVAVMLTLSIGLSRIYLGVHYPSDVAGGYAAAIAWTILVRVINRQWWRRRSLAPQTQP